MQHSSFRQRCGTYHSCMPTNRCFLIFKININNLKLKPTGLLTSSKDYSLEVLHSKQYGTDIIGPGNEKLLKAKYFKNKRYIFKFLCLETFFNFA